MQTNQVKKKSMEEKESISSEPVKTSLPLSALNLLKGQLETKQRGIW